MLLISYAKNNVRSGSILMSGARPTTRSVLKLVYCLAVFLQASTHAMSSTLTCQETAKLGVLPIFMFFLEYPLIPESRLPFTY
jgi:hypothetical protein